MNTDKITNWLGLGQAIAVEVGTYIASAHADGTFGWDNPVFWLGTLAAGFMAAKAWFTNKPSTPSEPPKV